MHITGFPTFVLFVEPEVQVEPDESRLLTGSRGDSWAGVAGGVSCSKQGREDWLPEAGQGEFWACFGLYDSNCSDVC